MITNFVAAGTMPRPRTSFHPHSHHYWEAVLYTNGTGWTTVGAHSIPFRPGTIICNPPGVKHSEVAENGFQNRWVAFRRLNTSAEVPVVHESPDHPVFSIVEIMHYESHLTKPTTEMIVANLFNTFMIYLNEWQTTVPHGPELSHVQRQIVANVRNPAFQIADAFAAVPMSRDHLRRLFKDHFGASPIRYLIDLRMERAKALLQIGYNVKEVADRVGLPDQYYFSRLFKKTQGISPSEYKERLTG